MALHVTRFAKRPTGIGALPANADASAAAKTRSIPLRLGPLLSRYRGQGSISLRIERLPHRARLSGGQNNGDHSWSVSLSDLDDLAYLVPADMHEPHTLAIRVISREGSDGTTLALLDYDVLHADSLGWSPPESAPAATTRLELEHRELRQELATLKGSLAAAETALTQQREESERIWTEKAREATDSALHHARTEWDAEFAKRLAAVSERAESMLESRRRAWQTELDVRLVESEKRAQEQSNDARTLWQREAEAALARARADWQAGETDRLAAAETKWQTQAAAALAEARTDAARRQAERAELERLRDELARSKAASAAAQESLRADAAGRLAAVEADWRSRSANELASVRAEAARNQADGAEFKRLREELASIKRSLADSEFEIKQVRLEAAQAGAGWRQATDAAIARAKNDWKSEEAARFAAAEARWREKSAAALAEFVARHEHFEASSDKGRAETAPAPRDDTELRGLREEIKKAHTALAARDGELVQARERWLQESAEQYVQAREEWKSGESTRLAAAEARWREQLAELAALHEQAEAALREARANSQPEPQAEGELQGLRQEIATLRAALAERENALKQAREDRGREYAADIAQAQEEWRTKEAARLAAAEDRHDEAMDALRCAETRREKAEAELVELRAHPLTESEPEDRVTILKLRDELERMKINLELRDIELRQARSAASDALGRWREESQAQEPDVHPGRFVRSARSNRPNEEKSQSRALLRDVALVAGLAVLGTFLYPTVVAMIPDGWLPQFGQTASETEPVRAVVSSKPRVPTPVVAVSPSDVVVRSAKVHADPSKDSAVLALLARDTKITPITQRGNWVLVSVDGLQADGTQRQGWVYASFLKSVPQSSSSSAPSGGR